MVKEREETSFVTFLESGKEVDIMGISEREKSIRKREVSTALKMTTLGGNNPSEFDKETLNRYANGEISLAEAEDIMIQYALRPNIDK